MDHAVANVIAYGIAPEQALRAATQVPADAVGATTIGRIAVGSAADFVGIMTSFFQ